MCFFLKTLLAAAGRSEAPLGVWDGSAGIMKLLGEARARFASAATQYQTILEVIPSI